MSKGDFQKTGEATFKKQAKTLNKKALAAIAEDV